MTTTDPSIFSTVPPNFLIDRVFPLQNSTEEANRRSFVDSGQRSLAELERLMAAAGRSMEEFVDVLDWGCGPGRVTLRVLEKYGHVRMIGVDTDAGAIEWLNDLGSDATFLTIEPHPPMPLPDERFELVINHSVLTHIDGDAQRAWLAEITRLLRPGGLFVTSVHGVNVLLETVPHTHHGFDPANPWFRPWQSERLVYVAEDSYVGSSHHDGYHTTFQDPATVEVLSDYWLEPVVVIYKGDLGFQDQLLMRKRTEAEAAARRAIEVGSEAPAAAAAVGVEDDDSRLARLERTTMLSTMALSELGRKIARLEETVRRATVNGD
jgi:SAM-dependent methyltransferase